MTDPTEDKKRLKYKKRLRKRRQLGGFASILSPDWEETLLNLMERDSWYYYFRFSEEYVGDGWEHEGPERIIQMIEKGENRI